MDTSALKKKQKAAITSIIVNCFLIGLKYFLFLISSSIALKADAIHSFSDLISSIMVFLGVRLSLLTQKRLPRALFYIENIIALFISLVILRLGYGIFLGAIKGEEYNLTNHWIALGGIFITIVTAYLVSRYKIKIGRETDSPSVMADGYDSRMDMYSSCVVFVGVLGSKLGMNLDKLAAVVVAFFIFKSGLEILIKSIGALVMARKADERFYEKIVETFHIPDIKKIINGLSKLAQFAGNVYTHNREIIKKIALVMVIVIMVVYLVSGIYIVQPDESAICLRFGREIPGKGSSPGIHYRFPWPIETVEKVSISKINRIAIGYSLDDTESKRSISPASRMISRDENIVHVTMLVQYQVKDPGYYLFNFKEQKRIIEDIGESVLRKVIGETPIDDVLTTGKSEIRQRSRQLIQELIDKYEIGVSIVNVELKDIQPPSEVKSAFNEVISAREDRKTFINRALGYKNEAIPSSRGEANQMIAQAEANKHELINKAKGTADWFTKFLAEYEKSPEITGNRIYLEAMEIIMQKIKKYAYESNKKDKVIDIRLYEE